MFKDYSNSVSKEPIDETVADLMINVENMITSSNAFKMQENRPVINQMKWQTYKIKKIPLTSLFMILNKINGEKLDTIIQETLQYKTFTKSEINQLADVFLGKCIMETKNVDSYIIYLKTVMDNELWYVYDEQESRVISFRDTVIDRLENEYNRLTRIAGHIEDVFKNQIKDDAMTNKLEGSEDYLKKKNIIVSLITLIGSFYKGKIISTSLVLNILNNLKEQYEENPDTRKIYIELWLVLWTSISYLLINNSVLTYNENIEWLTKQMKILEVNSEQNKTNMSWDITRLLSLIGKSLNVSSDISHYDDNNKVNKKSEDITLFDIKIDEIHGMRDKSEFVAFKKKYDDRMQKMYIKKYILSKCVPKSGAENSIQFINTVNMIKTYLINNNSLHKIVDELLEDDDIICDYPLFRKNIKQYIG